MWLCLLLFLFSSISAAVPGTNEFPPTEGASNSEKKNTILLMGGFNNDAAQDGMLVLSADKSEWKESRLKLPYKAGSACAVYFNEEIYLIGGGEQILAVNKLDKNHKWSRLADLNVGRYGISKSCLEWNGYIWVFGGQDKDKKSLKSVERYDPKENKWTLMREMKYFRSWAAALLWNDQIIVSGGYGGLEDNYARTDTVESLNSGRWIDFPNLPGLRNSHALVHYKNNLILIGGFDGEMAHSDVWKADPRKVNPAWKRSTPMRSRSLGLAGIVLDEEIYAIGGQFNDTVYLDKVEIFNGKNWRAGPSLPYELSGMSATIIPQDLADRLIAYSSE